MSLKIDESGRRYVEVEVEVPGTPEQVWQAIATGPGVSSWFVPCEVDGRDGGTVTCDFGAGMKTNATITAWEPPRRFAAESPGYMPGMPPLGTEWVVESRSGDTCVVRVVHSLFASTDDWDDQLTSTESGWPTFFRILEIYLRRFPGARSANVSMAAMTAGGVAQNWAKLAGALGIEDATAGERFRATGDGAPALSGTVEPIGEDPNGRRVLLRLDEPGPGVAMIGAFDCGGTSMVTANLYLYGDAAAETAAREEPVWRAWLAEHFPSANAAPAS